jgi:hypothetical protein
MLSGISAAPTRSFRSHGKARKENSGLSPAVSIPMDARVKPGPTI